MAVGASVLAHVALVAWLLSRTLPAPQVEFSVAPSGGALGTAEKTAEPHIDPVATAAPAPAPSVVKKAAPRKTVTVTVADTAADTDPATATGSGAATEAGTGTATGTATGAATGAGAEGPAKAPVEQLAVAPTPDADAIRAALQAAVHYPRLARSQGVEGQVLLRFRVDEQGNAHDVTVLRSAGALLDDAAQAAVQRAAPYRSPPGWVRVPVQFSLRESP